MVLGSVNDASKPYIREKRCGASEEVVSWAIRVIAAHWVCSLRRSLVRFGGDAELP